MKHFNFVFLGVILAVLHNVATLPSEITFYSNDNYTGESITLNQAHVNFGGISEALGGLRSICYVGPWSYTKKTGTVTLWPESIRRCSKVSEGYEDVQDVYLNGPSETSTPAITFSSGRDILIVETDSISNVNITSNVIVIYHIYTSGRTSWKIFSEHDFQGESVCLQPKNELNRYRYTDLGFNSIGSAIRDC